MLLKQFLLTLIISLYRVMSLDGRAINNIRDLNVVIAAFGTVRE